MTARVLPFPAVPVGARASKQLLDVLTKRVPSERDMVTEDGEICEHAIIDLAWHKAKIEQEAYRTEGHYVSMSVLYREQLTCLTSEARAMAAVRKARIEFERLPLREQLIRSLENELHRLEHGMAMGPVDTDKIERVKKQIAEVRERDQ